MPIKFFCERCGQKIGVSSERSGQKISCPRCNNEVSVPKPESADDAEVKTPLLSVNPTAETKTTPYQVIHGFEGLDSKGEGTRPTEPPSAADTEQEATPFQPISKHWISQLQLRSGNEKEQDKDDVVEFRTSRLDDEEDMDLTPMVDVTFLLLIFFMVTASFSTERTIDTPPPNKQDEGQSQQVSDPIDNEDSILLEITENNELIVDDEVVSDASLLDGLFDDIRARDNKRELFVKAHALSRHELLLEAIDAANEVQLDQIRIATIGEYELEL